MTTFMLNNRLEPLYKRYTHALSLCPRHLPSNILQNFYITQQIIVYCGLPTLECKLYKGRGSLVHYLVPNAWQVVTQLFVERINEC